MWKKKATGVDHHIVQLGVSPKENKQKLNFYYGFYQEIRKAVAARCQCTQTGLYETMRWEQLQAATNTKNHRIHVNNELRVVLHA